MCSTDVASATNPIDSASIFMGGKENPEMKHQINLFTDRAAIFNLPPGHPRGQNQNGCCIGKKEFPANEVDPYSFRLELQCKQCPGCISKLCVRLATLTAGTGGRGKRGVQGFIFFLSEIF